MDHFKDHCRVLEKNLDLYHSMKWLQFVIHIPATAFGIALSGCWFDGLAIQSVAMILAAILYSTAYSTVYVYTMSEDTQQRKLLILMDLRRAIEGASQQTGGRMEMVTQ